MNKKILCLFGIFFLLNQTCLYALAKNEPMNNSMKIAIKKYKNGNYTGCLQDCQDIVQKHPSAIAYYYMAISYVQAGMKNEAIDSYGKALSMKPSAQLSSYASLGKKCLETPDQCVPDANSQSNPTEMDKFINSSNEGISDSTKKDFRQKHLNTVKNQINKGKELDDYSFQKLNQKQDENHKIAQGPTNEEIQNALKVLKEAGMNTYNTEGNSNLNDVYAQNAELMQLKTMFGGNSQNNSQSMDMLPMMLMQNKNGTSNYSPQMVQSMIMSSMMGNLNYNIDTSKE